MSTAVPDSVCRWALDCAQPAVVVVRHSTLGEIPACLPHATPHADWERVGAEQAAAGRVFIHPNGATSPLPPGEPEPECWCPDTPRKRVPYCPRDGTKAQRGIDPLADDVD